MDSRSQFARGQPIGVSGVVWDNRSLADEYKSLVNVDRTLTSEHWVLTIEIFVLM